MIAWNFIKAKYDTNQSLQIANKRNNKYKQWCKESFIDDIWNEGITEKEIFLDLS
jgi:hypothetical protein